MLLDTDVFSYLLKAGDQRGDPYRAHVRDKRLAVSFVTVGELLYGAEKRGWGAAKREALDRALRTVVIVPFDLQVCQAYAEISNLKTPEGAARTIAAVISERMLICRATSAWRRRRASSSAQAACIRLPCSKRSAWLR